MNCNTRSNTFETLAFDTNVETRAVLPCAAPLSNAALLLADLLLRLPRSRCAMN
jgi:hypothetical protein